MPLDGRPYDVVVRAGALERVAVLAGAQRGSRVAIVGDKRLARTAASIAAQFRRRKHDVTTLLLPANERLKSLQALEPLYGKLLSAQLDRRSTIVGLGGGTIGDAIGFLAATYMRGIRFVSVPSTLLAGVDSAIGGKSGVNHALGKNLIGVFAQPSLVVVDPLLMRSLDRRDRISGLGEIVKYGLIGDAQLYHTLRRRWADLVELREPLCSRVIARCVEMKAQIVAADERERTGLRAQLNFGHTVAHALENVAGYGTLRHGEAVIVGMRAATALSSVRGHLDADTAHEIDAFLASLPVPSSWRGYAARDVAEATKHDKKRGAKGIRFVLLDRIGHTVSDDGITQAELTATLRSMGFA